MTIPMLNYPSFRPYTNIQPFTVRDGATYLLILEGLKDWIRDTLVPHIDSEIAGLTKSWDENVKEVIDAMEALSVALIARIEAAEAMIGDAVTEAEAAKVAAEAARDLAEMYASNVVAIQDSAVAALADDPASATRAALDLLFVNTEEFESLLNDINTGRLSDSALQGKYVVYREWDGSAYPARIEGALNIFFGPTDPGLAMGEDDYWANPNVTTLDAVAAAIQNLTSPVYAAVQKVTDRSYIDIPLSVLSGSAPLVQVGTTPLYGYQCAPNASTRLGGTVKKPYGWISCRVRIIGIHLTGNGDVRLSRSASAYRPGVVPVNFTEVTNTATVPVAGTVFSYLVTGSMEVESMEEIFASISRSGTSAADTLEENIYILGARLERVS